MNRVLTFAIILMSLVIGLSRSGCANLAAATWGLPASLCRQASDTAERRHTIPAQLMAAIGRVESGRRDPQTGAMGPWPWTINAEGQGAFFDSKSAAIAAVRALQARGVRSIDVGCMQVNLMHHPTAFASLEQAFDPIANADYAADFLARLYDDVRSWPKAVGMYHSATPELGNPYQAKVMAVWPEEQRNPAPALANAWRATMPATPFRGGSGGLVRPVGSTRSVAMTGAGGMAAAGAGFAPPVAGTSGGGGRDLSSYRARPIQMVSQINRVGG
jgi:hypothetical protein